MRKLKPRYKALLLVAALALSIYVSLIGARIVKYSGGSFSGLRGVLNEAARSEDVAVVRVLLAGGSNPSRIDQATGMTPLVWAAGAGNLKLSKILLSAGADPEGSGLPYDRPLYIAIINGEEDVAALLRERGARYDIVDAIFSGDEAYVRRWIDDGGDIRAIAFSKGNLLHAAVEYRSVEAARLLLEFGVDPTLGGTEWMSHSPLESARDIAWTGEPGITELVALFEAHIAEQVAVAGESP